MPMLAGFTDYDASGKPFMGLYVEDGAISLKIYLSHKDNALKAAAEIGRQLNEMAIELGKMHNKIQPVEGVIGNGTVRRQP